MFKGNTRGVFVDKRDYGGSLWRQVEEALQFVLRNIHLGAKIEGVYRKDIYELPPESIRELIINAVMNCGFLQPSHIQVVVYDDRLEITSPGGLLPGVTIERMKEGKRENTGRMPDCVREAPGEYRGGCHKSTGEISQARNNSGM